MSALPLLIRYSILFSSIISEYMDADIQSQLDNVNTLWDSGRIEEDIQEFHRMAEETSDVDMKAAILLNEAKCYIDLDHIDDADRILKSSFKLKPEDVYVRMRLSEAMAWILARQGKHKKAALLYKDMLKEYAQLWDTTEYRNTYVDICFRRAIELVAADEHHVAIPLIKKVLTFSNLTLEDQQDLHFGLGCCYEKLREYDLAIDEYRRVIELNLFNTNETDAHYYIARLYVYRGGFAHAKQHLETILRNYKEKPLFFSLKYVYEALSEACKG